MGSRAVRARLWLLEHLPTGVLARPAEWFLALLCVLSGGMTLLGVVDSDSLEHALPALLVTAWGVALAVGGGALAVGLSSIRDVRGGQYVITRVAAYRLGLRLLGISSIAYAASLLSAVGVDALLATLPLLAFAGMCGVRLLTLGGRS